VVTACDNDQLKLIKIVMLKKDEETNVEYLSTSVRIRALLTDSF
jgi:hypothetical protein